MLRGRHCGAFFLFGTFEWMNGKADLLRALWQAGLIQLRTEAPWFRWASGIESPIYLDFRRCLALPSLRTAIVDALEALVQAYAYQGIAGIATGGIAWAAWLAARQNKPMGYVRAAPKAHGLGHAVEGLSPSEAPVLLIEDVVSTGQSLSQAAARLHASGYPLAIATALWDYQLTQPMPGHERFISLFQFSDALQAWEAYLSSRQKQTLHKWHQTCRETLAASSAP